VRRWWQEYKKPEKLKYLNDVEVASRLKKRIINPHIIEEQFEERESKWYFGGEDWRLTPSIWLFMVAPSFKLSRPWRKFLESIKDQPAFNRFIKHYDELEAEVDSLISEYTNTAASIAKDDPNFAGQWEQLQDELVVYTEMHCKPSSRELAPSEKKIKRMPMPKFRKYAFKKFKQLIPDLEDKLQDIEKKLQQVCDDLETV
jgi:hypothetical protein